MRANRLQFAMWVLAGVAAAAAYVMPFVTPLARGTDKAARIGVLTGDAGARLVWAGR